MCTVYSSVEQRVRSFQQPIIIVSVFQLHRQILILLSNVSDYDVSASLDVRQGPVMRLLEVTWGWIHYRVVEIRRS